MMKIEFNGKEYKKIKELLAETTIANLDKFLFDNNQITLSDFVELQEEENKNDACSSALNSGDWGSASNSGDYGSALNSGDYGSASNSGDYGSASNSGCYGSASNSGYWGSALNSGVGGNASNSGYCGSASNGGDCGSASNSGNCGSALNSGDWGIAMSNAFFSTVSNKCGLHAMITEFVTSFDPKCYNELKNCISKQNAKLIRFTKQNENKHLTLLKGKLFEVITCDGIRMAVVETREMNGYKIYKGISYGNDFYKDIFIYNKRIVLADIPKMIVVEKDGVFSHGDTVEQAIKDFRYKVSNRDMSKYEYLKKEKGEVSTDELIKAYRVITGSCETGTKMFVESLGELREKYTVAEAIKMLELKNAYGFETFKQFLRGEAK